MLNNISNENLSIQSLLTDLNREVEVQLAIRNAEVILLLIKKREFCRKPMIDDNGNKHFFNKDGKYHREDSPALEKDIGNFWMINGKFHRMDGPAIEYVAGYKSWYYHGEQIDCQSQEEFEKIINEKNNNEQ